MSELYHHGVKGQRWGVRRYQNPDGTLTEAGKKRYLSAAKSMRERGETYLDLYGDLNTGRNASKEGIIKKGTIAYRVSSGNESLDSKRKYASLTKEGRDFYQEAYVEGMLNNTENHSDNMVNSEYKAVRDLKIANSREVGNYIASMHPEKIKMKELNNYINDFYDVMDSNYIPKTNKEREAIDYINKARHYLNKENTKIMGEELNNNPVFEHFRKLGYDAISDVIDGGVERSHAPVIFLNPKDSLEKVKEWTW